MFKYTHIVTNEEQGQSINQILKSNYTFSARFKTKIKYQELLYLNNQKARGYFIADAGDVIAIKLPDETSDFPPQDIPIDIIYEDDDLLIINKEPGIIIHPTKGHPIGTLANAVMKYMLDSKQSFKIRFVNRIDMDTTGIVIVAKNANAQNTLMAQMKNGLIIKKYIALVKRNIESDEIEIEAPVGRPSLDEVWRDVMPDGGKPAHTSVKVLKRYLNYTLVECTLHTGRTHQIRVHLKHIGHPICGDNLYGGEDELMNRQALHAYYIRFEHPFNGETVEITADYPKDLLDAISKLS